MSNYAVLAVGGGGCNAACNKAEAFHLSLQACLAHGQSTMAKQLAEEVQFVFLDTNEEDLRGHVKKVPAGVRTQSYCYGKRHPNGKLFLDGQGTGEDYEAGVLAIEEALAHDQAFISLVSSFERIEMVAGLGQGGTGFGFPTLLRFLRGQGTFTLPFLTAETVHSNQISPDRAKRIKEEIEALDAEGILIGVTLTDSIYAQNVPMNQAFKTADSKWSQATIGLTRALAARRRIDGNCIRRNMYFGERRRKRTLLAAQEFPVQLGDVKKTMEAIGYQLATSQFMQFNPTNVGGVVIIIEEAGLSSQAVPAISKGILDGFEQTKAGPSNLSIKTEYFPSPNPDLVRVTLWASEYTGLLSFEELPKLNWGDAREFTYLAPLPREVPAPSLVAAAATEASVELAPAAEVEVVTPKPKFDLPNEEYRDWASFLQAGLEPHTRQRQMILHGNPFELMQKVVRTDGGRNFNLFAFVRNFSDFGGLVITEAGLLYRLRQEVGQFTDEWQQFFENALKNRYEPREGQSQPTPLPRYASWPGGTTREIVEHIKPQDWIGQRWWNESFSRLKPELCGQVNLTLHLIGALGWQAVEPYLEPEKPPALDRAIGAVANIGGRVSGLFSGRSKRANGSAEMVPPTAFTPPTETMMEEGGGNLPIM